MNRSLYIRVTAQSLFGILKNAGEKSYHPFFSADRKHDQTFVKFAMEEMLNKAEIDPDKYIIIESDTSFS